MPVLQIIARLRVNSFPHAQMSGNLGTGRSYQSSVASLNSSLFRLNPASFRGSGDSQLDAPFSRHISILFFSYMLLEALI